MIKKIKDWYNYLKNNYKQIGNTFKNNLKDPQYRQKYIILFLIISISALLINLLFTFAYYYDDDSFPLIQAKVGDFRDKDYILLVYIEDDSNNGQYHLTYSVPTNGYTYKSYNCKNNSTLVFNDVTKEVTATLKVRDTCSIYFDLNE